MAEQLQRALDSRGTVEQAKGVVAERPGVTPGMAFGLLRATRAATTARCAMSHRMSWPAGFHTDPPS